MHWLGQVEEQEVDALLFDEDSREGLARGEQGEEHFESGLAGMGVRIVFEALEKTGQVRSQRPLR